MNGSRKAGSIDNATMADVVEWDVHNWSHAIHYWIDHTAPCDGSTVVLDLGARRGGVSLLFALQGATQILCSDLHGPAPAARDLHERHQVTEQIFYIAADATSLPLPDRSVDIVAAKSVLGGIGSHGRRDLQEKAIAEAWRVLRPSGWFCFAENLTGAGWHRWSRRIFTDWGGRWGYLSIADLRSMLGAFREVRLETRGHLAVLGRTEGQRRLLGRLDDFLTPILPSSAHYLGYGVAQRP